MIFILIFLLLLFYRIANISNKKERELVIIAISISSFLSVIFLILLQSEIFLNGGTTGTIGTDARSYYLNAKETIASGINPFVYIYETLTRDYHLDSRAYQITTYLILLSSPIQSAVILKLFNIVLFQNIIVLVYTYIKNVKVIEYKHIKLILILLAINGGFIFTATRVFKDTTYIYLMMEFLVSLNIFINRSTISSFMKILLISIVSSYFRPYSFFLNVIVFIVEIYIKKFRKLSLRNNAKMFKKITILLFLAMLSSLSIVEIIEPIDTFLDDRFEASKDFNKSGETNDLRDAFHSGASGSIYSRLVLGTARFLALPSPFRTLFTEVNNNINWFEGVTGKFLIFQWSFIYYIGLISFILILIKNHKYLYDIYSLFLLNIMLISTYAVLYGGAAQTRWKLSLIILTIISLSLYTYSSSKKQRIYFILAVLVLFFLELLWAMQWI